MTQLKTKPQFRFTSETEALLQITYMSDRKATFPFTTDLERLVCFLGTNKGADQQLVISTVNAVQRNGHHCFAVNDLNKIIAFTVNNSLNSIYKYSFYLDIVSHTLHPCFDNPGAQVHSGWLLEIHRCGHRSITTRLDWQRI